MRSRPLRSGWLLTGGVFLGAVGAALAPAGPNALVPFKLLVASAADDVYVAVVVDFGTGSNLSTIAKCVPVPAGSTDADALASAVGESNVAYSSSGLVCQIDGYPVNGVQNCNASSGSNYYFWSYWHGASGSWSYANNGPAGQQASDGDVEGWRFQNPGPANPKAPPPETAPDYASICSGISVVPPTTVATTTPTTGVTTTTSASTPTTRASTPGTPTTASGSTHTATTALHTTTTVHATSGSSTTPSASGAEATTTSRPSTATSSSTASSKSHKTLASAATAKHSSGSSGGAPLPIILVVVVVAVLGMAAFVLIRRRSPADDVE